MYCAFGSGQAFSHSSAIREVLSYSIAFPVRIVQLLGCRQELSLPGTGKMCSPTIQRSSDPTPMRPTEAMETPAMQHKAQKEWRVNTAMETSWVHQALTQLVAQHFEARRGSSTSLRSAGPGERCRLPSVSAIKAGTGRDMGGISRILRLSFRGVFLEDAEALAEALQASIRRRPSSAKRSRQSLPVPSWQVGSVIAGAPKRKRRGCSLSRALQNDAPFVRWCTWVQQHSMTSVAECLLTSDQSTWPECFVSACL